MKKHLSLLMLLAALIVPWASNAQEIVTIGDASSSVTHYTLPVNMFYNYSMTQQIYTATEIGVAGTITSIAFEYTNSSSFSMSGVQVYMKNVSKTEFTSTSDMEPISASDLVWTGTLSATGPGWVNIQLDAPFVYDGTSNLLVCFYDPTNGYPGSAYVYRTTATTPYLGISYYSDSYTPSLTDVTSFSGSMTRYQYRANIQIEMTVGEISCYPVRNLTIVDPTAESLTLTWMDTSNFSATYSIYSVTPTDTILLQSGITDTSYMVDNLNPNTVYTFAVMADCGFGDESTRRFVQGRTACAPINVLPFEYGFEDANTGTSADFPTCWTRLNDATSSSNYYPYVSNTTSYVHSGSKGLYWYHSTTTTYADNEYAILPPVDLDVFNISDLTLAFYAKTTSASYHPQPIIGVMTDPTDTTTFTPVNTFSATQITTDWQLFDVSLASYTGTGAYVAIKWPRPSSTSYMVIDDVVLTDEWCNTPGNVTATASVESVTLTWSSNGGTSFTVFLGNDTVTGIVDTTYTFNNLTPNTPYNYGVATECSDALSIFVMGSRYTLCVPIDSLPYVQDFEDAAIGNSTSTDFVNCMYRLNNGTTYFGYPYVGGSTYNHTTGGAKGLYWYNTTTTGTYGDYQYVVLPGVDTTLFPINTLKLSFWARPSSTSYSPQFHVGVMTDPTDPATFQQLAVINVAASTTWQEFSTILGSYTGTGSFVAIRALRSSSWYAYLDDITLSVAPTCPPVVSHQVATTASAARISWTPDPGFASAPAGYEVSYGFASDSPASATTVTTTEPLLILTGLVADTTYTVSISPICDDGFAPADVFNFTTRMLPCAEWDTTGFGGPTDTLTVGTPGTSTSSVMPVNNGYNYSYCQHLILASHLPSTGPQNFSGIAFDYAYSQPMTHATNCLIYMGNTTRANFTVSTPADSVFVPYSDLTLVYSGPLNCTTSGWNYFNFNQGSFAYDGTSNIVVAIVNNSGSHDGTSFIFRYETTSAATGGAMTHRVYNDNTPYGPTEMDAARANQSYWRSNMKLLTGGGECLSQASCSAPAVTVQQDAQGDIEVSWIPGYQETSWDLDYKAGDAGAWVNVLSGTALTSHTFLLNDLQPNTHYTFRVTPNCTDTLISGTASFTTPCGLFSVPFSEDFDTWSSTSSDPLPNCWDKHTNYSTNYPYASTSYHHSGSKSMYMYSTNSTYSYMVLPQFNLPIDSTVVSFWLYKSNTSYTHNLKVGVMTDPDDYTTFTQVAEVAPTTLSTWEPFEVSLRSYTGTGRYIAIMSPDGVYSYPYLDDLLVDRISDCPRVENVTVYNIMQTTATVAWDADSNGGNYVVEYGPAGFTPGTGTAVSVSYVDSLDISGLSASTAYDVYVRALCSSDTSAWSYVESFYTACDMITSLPYIEDFESYSSGSSYPINPCWTKGTSSSTNYPYPYSTNAVSGSRSLYFYGYHPSSTSTTPIYSYAALPQFQAPINSLGMDFKVRTSTSSGTYYTTYLLVGVMTNPNDITTFTAVDTIDLFGATPGSIHDVSVSFANYTGSGLHIAIYDPVPPLYGTSTYDYSYAYVDDIVVDLLPLCPRVENIVASPMLTSATISWTDTSTNVGWNVEYDTVAFTPGTGHTAIHVTDTFCVINGLDSGAFYYVYVYPDCDTNIYARYITFRTLAASPASVPYFCDFESAGVNGWDFVNGSQNNYWIVGNATNNGGSRSMYITDDGTNNSYSGAASYVFATRTFNLTDTGAYLCTFDWKAQGESSYDFIRAALVPAGTQFNAGEYCGFDNGEAPSGNVPAGGIALDGSGRLNLNGSSWQTRLTEFNISTLGTYTLVFLWRNDGSVYNQPPAAIDNVGLQRNTCPSVTNITVSAVTESSATVQWVASGNETQWAVTVGNTTMVVSSPSAILSGLSAMTDYTVGVRPICAVGDTGFAASVSFATEMCNNPEVVATGDPSTSTTTSYYVPVNNYYNYTLSETIIDSAELNGAMEISAIAYYYNYSSPSSAKTSVNIYLQPTNKTAFASSSDIVTLSSDAVLVYSGSLNCTQGWNTFAFSTPYQYNGIGNVMVIVDDNSGDYDGSTYTFKTASHTDYKTIVYYSDSYDPDVTSISSSYSGTKAYYQYRPMMQLISCGSSTCNAPEIDTAIVGETEVTLNWHGSASDYEVAAVAGNWIEPASGTPVTGLSTIVTGLTPGTPYAVGVRAVCAEGVYSDWYVINITTIEHACIAPTSVTVPAATIDYTSAVINWTPAEADQNDFEVRLIHSADTAYFEATGTSYTATGLIYNTAYTVAVRAICGANNYSDWSDAASFRTAACAVVTGVTVSNVTANSATVTWSGNAGSYEVAYGLPGTSTDDCESVTTTSTTATLTGLTDITTYVVYVRSVCGEGVYSDWSTGVQFTTEMEDPNVHYYDITVTVNDPAMGTATGSGRYAENTQVEIRATSNTGYHFVKWQDNVTDSVRTITVTANATYTATFAANGTQGIEDVEGAAISLYPNPASSTVTLTGIEGEATVTVVDMNGRELYKLQTTNYQLTIDISQLSQGAYFVRITGERVNAIRKLIVR